MFRKALMPLLWIIIAIAVLAAFAVWVQRKYGEECFCGDSSHHHGHRH